MITGASRAANGVTIWLEDAFAMSCHVWINVVLADIIEYADRNELAELGETLRQTAARVAPLLEAADGAKPSSEEFDLFPVDVRRAVAGAGPVAAASFGPPLRRVI